MKIALCDDEKPFLLWFKKRLERQLPAVQAEEFKIDLYSDGRSLLKAQAKQKYDVIFLDIQMPEIDGMAIARQLWRQSGESIVIFTTVKEELVFQALRVHPFEFLKKSDIENELPRLLRDILRELHRSGELLTLKCRKGMVSIPVQDVYYLESRRNDIAVYTKEKEYIIRDSLSVKEKELAPYGFIRTHSGFLVNSFHIFMADKMFVILDDGRRVPVSRNRYKIVKEKLLKNITKL